MEGFAYYNNGEYDPGYLDYVSGLQSNDPTFQEAVNYFNKYKGQNAKGINNILVDDYIREQASNGIRGGIHDIFAKGYSQQQNNVDINPILNAAKEKVSINTDYTPENEEFTFDESLSGVMNPSDVQKTKGKFDWNSLGQMAPIVDNLGKLIHNVATPVDDSNIIAAKAYREEIPMMNLPEIGGKISYKNTDRNALINPILNTGRSTINDIKNNAVTGSSAIAGILGATSNTQKAVGNAFLDADARDLNNELQVGNFNFGIDRANVESARAEQLANIARGEKIAAARVADASQREALNNLKGKSIDVMSSALAEGVGDLSRQNIQSNWIKNNPVYAEAVAALNKRANGGLLTKKRRRK
jgi:hypothetical protein